MKISDKVHWQSQSQGYHRVKEGEVVAVVPAGQYPDREAFPSLYKNAGVGMHRDHESYVVKATYKNRYGRRRTSIYWPRAKSLQREGTAK